MVLNHAVDVLFYASAAIFFKKKLRARSRLLNAVVDILFR